MSIYTELKVAGVPLDNHESDLYALLNDASSAILRTYEHRGSVRVFRSRIDDKLWYDIPFAYEPWWEARSIRHA